MLNTKIYLVANTKQSYICFVNQLYILKLKTMKLITLKNGNIALINSIRYAHNKCIFTFSIYEKYGNWLSIDSSNYSIGYYESVEDYLMSNY